jgi:hypothetical protein
LKASIEQRGGVNHHSDLSFCLKGDIETKGLSILTKIKVLLVANRKTSKKTSHKIKINVKKSLEFTILQVWCS